MGRRNGAGDLEHPDELLAAVHWKRFAVADVVQRGLGTETELGPDAIGDQSVQAGALVHFVEMRQRTAFVQHAAVAAGGNRRAVHIVEQAFRQVGGRRQVLQALLILDADHVAAEIVGDAQSGDVHLALIQNLVVGEVGFGIGPGQEVHALGVQPGADTARLLVAHLAHGGVEGGLAQPLLEDAGGMQQFIGDDGVVHAHAAFVENAQDGLVAAQLPRQARAGLFGLRRQPERGERMHVAEVVAHGLAAEPLAQARQERLRRSKFSLHSVE